MRHISLFLLLVALLLAIIWSATTIKLHPFQIELEPVITSISIGAAIVGFFIDPILNERAKRKEVLESLVLEIDLNMKIINMDMFNEMSEPKNDVSIYPRLVSPSLDRALSSGLFNKAKDNDLRAAMMITRSKIDYFNSYMTTF
jgi:hypothetical protein